MENNVERHNILLLGASNKSEKIIPQSTHQINFYFQSAQRKPSGQAVISTQGAVEKK